MATYTNQTSLANLQVGDVITYTQNTAIDFGGAKVRVEIYGKNTYSSGTGRGGKAQFDIQSSNSLRYFYYTPSYGSSLIYDPTQSSTSRTEYYRIGVGGDAVNRKNGGGLTGEAGANDSSSYSSFTASAGGGGGGTQTAGGAGGSAGGNYTITTTRGSPGTFGHGGSGGGQTGSDGWYGGGSGGYSKAGQSGVSFSQTSASGGGGTGSGFIIGQSTTTYPSGYMGGSSSNISALEAAVSNATLTQGGAPDTTAKMVITILQPPGPSLTGVSILHAPNKTTYYVGDTFDPTGLQVTASYSDGTSQLLNSNDYTLSPTPTTTSPGTQTIYAVYSGFQASFTINVIAVAITSLSLSGNYPLTFNVGDTFSYAGLVVTANYNNGTTEVISSGYTVSSPNMSTPGEKTVYVTYNSISTSYTITVIAPNKVIHYFDGTNFNDCEVYYVVDQTESYSPAYNLSFNVGTDTPPSGYVYPTITEETRNINGVQRTGYRIVGNVPVSMLGIQIELRASDIVVTGDNTFYVQVNDQNCHVRSTPYVRPIVDTSFWSYVDTNSNYVVPVTVDNTVIGYKTHIVDNPLYTGQFIIWFDSDTTGGSIDVFISYPYYYNNIVKCEPFYYNGSTFVEIG